MRLRSILLVLPLLLVTACGGDDDEDGDCIDVAGTWTFTDHCETSLIGGDITVTQSGCSITVDWGGPEPWSGSMSGNTMTMSGDTGGGHILTCTGEVVNDTWTSDCTPDACHVVVTRK